MPRYWTADSDLDWRDAVYPIEPPICPLTDEACREECGDRCLLEPPCGHSFWALTDDGVRCMNCGRRL